MPSAPTPRGPVRHSMRRLAVVGLCALTLVTILGFLGAWWWVLDLLAHFRVPALVITGLAAVALLVLRWWRLAGWALALVVLHLALVLPLYAGPATVPTDAPRLRVISYNVHSGNPRTAEAARHVATLAPDVVALYEVSQDQLHAFQTALPGYHPIAVPQDDPFGIAVLTRLPPTHARVLTLGAPWVPAIELSLPFGEHTIALAAIHPPPPVSSQLAQARNAVLHAAFEWAAAQPGPTIVVGDLNATPWSTPLRQRLADGPLRSTQVFGIQPTWPATLGPFGLPIDHALVTEHLVPTRRALDPSFGSDHRMLVVDLALRPAS